MKIFALFVCLFSLLLAGGWAQAQEPGQQNYGRVIQVPRQEINDWLKEEVAKSGGNIDKDRYHFIVGFSTGHYGQDPVHAIAMRRLAFTLLNNTMAAGDKVSSVAWEMDVWDTDGPITLTEKPGARKQFVDAVPYTTQQGSKGGHDTERALYETLQALTPEEARSTVVLMLTNSNQSQGPTGERVALFGSNNPRLTQLLQKLDYRTPPVRHSFTMQGEGRKLNVDVTALFPEQIKSLPNAPVTSRYPTFPVETWQPKEDRPPSSEVLPNPVAPVTGSTSSETTTRENNTVTRPAPSVEQKRGLPPWVWILLALIAIALIFFVVKALAKPKQPAPVVAAAPAGRPLPGAVEVVIGTKSLVLQPLTTIDMWKLVRENDSIVVHSDPPEEGKREEGKGSNPATPHAPPSAPRTAPAAADVVATLNFDEKRRLRVQAESDTQFLELKGINLGESNNRTLYVGLGEKLFCRVATSGVAAPTRLELTYHKEKKV